MSKQGSKRSVSKDRSIRIVGVRKVPLDLDLLVRAIVAQAEAEVAQERLASQEGDYDQAA